MNNTENTREYEILLDVVRQSYASVVWTHKIQEKQADIYSKRKNILDTINIIVATLTSCGGNINCSKQRLLCIKTYYVRAIIYYGCNNGLF